MVTELITPTPTGPQDFSQRVIDADDVVHTLNPRIPTTALCGRVWRWPWWEDDWLPDNYDGCDRCEQVTTAVNDAIGDAWGKAGPVDAVGWFVFDSADPHEEVHRLNPLHVDRALCGWSWVNPVDEGTRVGGPRCLMCTRVDQAGVGRTFPGAPKRHRQRPSKPKGQSGAKRDSGTSRRRDQDSLVKVANTAARKLRAAHRLDRASTTSLGRSKSVRAIPSGLPTLGRRRR